MVFAIDMAVHNRHVHITNWTWKSRNRDKKSTLASADLLASSSSSSSLSSDDDSSSDKQTNDGKSRSSSCCLRSFFFSLLSKLLLSVGEGSKKNVVSIIGNWKKSGANSSRRLARGCSPVQMQSVWDTFFICNALMMILTVQVAAGRTEFRRKRELFWNDGTCSLPYYSSRRRSEHFDSSTKDG